MQAEALETQAEQISPSWRTPGHETSGSISDIHPAPEGRANCFSQADTTCASSSLCAASVVLLQPGPAFSAASASEEPFET